MLWLLLAFASSLTFGIGSFIFKLSADQRLRSADVLCGLYLSGSLVLLVSSWSAHLGAISLITLAAGSVIAIGSSLGNSLYLKVLRAGPASLSAPLVNCSNLLVVIMSIVFFNEQLTSYKLVAIALFFISMGFLTFDPNERLAVKDKRWYWLIIATIVCIFFREGGLKIGHEVGLNTILILFYAYVYAFLFNGFMIYRQGGVQVNTKRGISLGMLVGLFSAGGLAFYAKALTLGPASLIAPIFAARSFVVVLLATLVCKERLSVCQIIAITLLIIAICLLCIT